MISFPNCKINLGLNVVRKRPDGFHDLETVFLPLAFTDVLEITRAADVNQACSLVLHGIPVDGEPENNLCIKAFRLIKNDYPHIGNITIHLLKNIFLGAGLGGGSADAAFVLTSLNSMFNLQLSQQQLLNYALQLGSDCPFFIINKAAFGTGRGEKLLPLLLDLSAYKLVLINPGIHVNTGSAFQQLTPAVPAKSLKELIQLPLGEWKNSIVNDFEEPVFKQHPVIKIIKEELYNCGAVYAAMSGSGSTVYGLFNGLNAGQR